MKNRTENIGSMKNNSRKDVTITHINLTAAEYNAYNVMYVDMCDEQQAKIDSYYEYLEKLAMADNGLNRKAEKNLSKINTYKNIKEDKEADIDALEQEISSLKSKIDRKNRSRNVLRDQYSNGDIDKKTLITSLEEITKVVDAIKGEISKKIKSKDMLIEEIIKINTIIENLKKELKSISNDLKENKKNRRKTNKNILISSKNIAKIENTRKLCDEAFGVADEDTAFSKKIFEPKLRKQK